MRGGSRKGEATNPSSDASKKEVYSIFNLGKNAMKSTDAMTPQKKASWAKTDTTEQGDEVKAGSTKNGCIYWWYQRSHTSSLWNIS